MKKLLIISLLFLVSQLFADNPTQVHGTNNLENIPVTRTSGNVTLGLKDVVEIDRLGLGVTPLYPLHIATTASDTHRNILIDNLISGSGKVDFGYTAWMSTSNDTLAQTVYGSQTSIETYDATDIGYAHYYDVHCDSTAGTQYGYFADADFSGVDLTNWYAFFARGRQLNVTGVKWGIYTLDLDTYIGCSDYTTPIPPNLILDNGVLGETGDSGYLILRGNDGVADTQLDMAIKLDVTDTTDYKLGIYNNAQAVEVASIDESGNLQIDGDFDLSGGNITQLRGFPLVITIPDAAPATNGDNLTVKAGTSASGGSPKTGGALYLLAGNNKSNTGNGGNIYITSGDDDGGTGNGGDIVVTCGKNLTSTNKGDLTVDANNISIASTGATAVSGSLSSTMTLVTVVNAATTFAVASNVVKVTGDAGGNTVATITGGVSGQVITLLFVDNLVTITDTSAATANTVNLSAAFTSAANTTLTLVNDGNKWFEVARSVN